MMRNKKITLIIFSVLSFAIVLYAGFQTIKYLATLQRIGTAACKRYEVSNALLAPCRFSIWSRKIFLEISSGDAAFICNIVEQTHESVDPKINDLWNRYKKGTWRVIYDGANQREHCEL